MQFFLAIPFFRDVAELLGKIDSLFMKNQGWNGAYGSLGWTWMSTAIFFVGFANMVFYYPKWTSPFMDWSVLAVWNTLFGFEILRAPEGRLFYFLVAMTYMATVTDMLDRFLEGPRWIIRKAEAEDSYSSIFGYSVRLQGIANWGVAAAWVHGSYIFVQHILTNGGILSV